MVRVSASRRLMSSRTNAALDGEAASATAAVAQQATAILSSRSSRSSMAQARAQPDPHAFPDRGRAGPQDQRQAAGAVGDDEFGEAGPDTVPGDQAPQQLVDAGRGPA